MTACEDLATKAELQELRDQLNAVLGKKEDGSVADVFKKGTGIALLGTVMTGTSYTVSQGWAATAVQSVSFSKPVSPSAWSVMAQNGTKVIATSGNGVAKAVPALSATANAAGTGAAGLGLATIVGTSMAASIALLSSLVSIVGTLVLNIATVKVLDGRIEAEARGTKVQIDALNTSMLRLFDKQQEDIDALVADLDTNQEKVRQNQQAIEATRFDIQVANEVNAEQGRKITEVSEAVRQLRIDNNNLREQVNQERLEAQEIIDGIVAQLDAVEANLDKAQGIIENQQSIINATTQQINDLQTTVEDLESRMRNTELQYIHLREEFITLKEEITGEIDVTNDRVTNLESLVIKTQKYTKQTGGGGAAAATRAAATAQDGVIKVVSKVAQVPYRPIGSDATTSYNRNSEFERMLDQLLPQIKPGGDLTPEQLQELQTGIKEGVSTNLSLLLGSLVVPRLDNISDQVTDTRQRNNVQQGICQSLNGSGGCPTVPGNPNTIQGLGGMNQGLLAGQNGISNLLGLGNLGLNQTIHGIVTNTNAVVNHPTYGLARIQSFASTAWRATRGDKIVSALNTMLIIHNAFMLSNNLANTTSEVLNLSLESLGIRDEEDTPINIGKAVKDKFESILKSWLGQAKYIELSKKIAAGNRIYQSGANIMYGIRNVIDSGQFMTETIYENVAFIGNALRRDGVVRENSYRLFPTQINSSSRLLYKLEAANDAVEIIEDIASEAKTIKEEIEDLKSNQKQFTEEIDLLTEKSEENENDNKDYAIDTPEPTENDEARGVENGD